MAKAPAKVTKRDLDKLRKQADADPSLALYQADAGQPGSTSASAAAASSSSSSTTSPVNGSRRRLAIDDYGAITLDAAREIATRYRADVAAGTDPQVQRKEQARLSITVEKAAEGYLRDLAERAKHGAKRGKRGSHAAMKRLLKTKILPRLGSVRLIDLKPDRVTRLHRRLSATPVEANRALTALSAVYGWADRAQLIPSGTNPTR